MCIRDRCRFCWTKRVLMLRFWCRYTLFGKNILYPTRGKWVPGVDRKTLRTTRRSTSFPVLSVALPLLPGLMISHDINSDPCASAFDRFCVQSLRKPFWENTSRNASLPPASFSIVNWNLWWTLFRWPNKQWSSFPLLFQTDKRLYIQKPVYLSVYLSLNAVDVTEISSNFSI